MPALARRGKGGGGGGGNNIYTYTTASTYLGKLGYKLLLINFFIRNTPSPPFSLLLSLRLLVKATF